MQGELYELENPTFNDYIMRGEVYMIPETHPNISMILLKIEHHHWYNEDHREYRFFQYK